MKKIGLISCATNNLGSIVHALNFLDTRHIIVTKKEQFKECSHLILPGVGSFQSGMQNLVSSDFVEPLMQSYQKGTPLLGICLGMQLFAQDSEEFGKNQGLKFIPSRVKKLSLPTPKAKLPHIGWNKVRADERSILFKGIAMNAFFYFAHSFAYECSPESYISATTQYYQHSVVASLEKDNLFGVQFHPEKSQQPGLQLLNNFINIC